MSPGVFLEKMKTCSKCKEEKSLEEFSKDRQKRDGLISYCKPCARAYKEKHREKIQAYNKAYYKENRGEIISSNAAYTKRRIANDPNLLMVARTRANLGHILKGKHNHTPTLELLGCTGEGWRTHLESTFKPGMTWENHGKGEGKWEVDHIAPVSSFDQEDHLQRLICWNYRNTQALWGHENMAKGDTISTEGGAA